MHTDHMVTMDNQISDFFDSMKNQDEALEQIVNHIRMFVRANPGRTFVA